MNRWQEPNAGMMIQAQRYKLKGATFAYPYSGDTYGDMETMATHWENDLIGTDKEGVTTFDEVFGHDVGPVPNDEDAALFMGQSLGYMSTVASWKTSTPLTPDQYYNAAITAGGTSDNEALAMGMALWQIAAAFQIRYAQELLNLMRLDNRGRPHKS
jgi:hypothetical protein